MSDFVRKSDVVQILKECKLDETLFEKDVFDKINNLPIAYSVGKVVEELEKLADENYKAYCITFNSDDRAEYDAYTNAIEIVKQGCITKDCNNCANYTEPDEVDNGCYLCCKGYENNYEPKVDNGDVSDDVCEWYADNKGNYKCKAHAETYDSRVLDWNLCPYCHRKIKVVE